MARRYSVAYRCSVKCLAVSLVQSSWMRCWRGRWSGLTATSNTPLDRDASTSKVHQMAPLKLRSSTSTYVYFVQMLRQTNIYVLLWFVFKLAVLEVVPELHPCNSGTGSRVAPVQLGNLPRARAQMNGTTNKVPTRYNWLDIDRTHICIHMQAKSPSLSLSLYIYI